MQIKSKTIRVKILLLAGDLIESKVENKLRIHADYRIRLQVWDQIRDQVWSHIRNQSKEEHVYYKR